MSTETWVVLADAANPWVLARHHAATWRGELIPVCNHWRRDGRYRALASEEVERHRPCGACVGPEHDGSDELSAQAEVVIRDAAAAAAHASMMLREFGYFRLARSLRNTSKDLYYSADRFGGGT